MLWHLIFTIFLCSMGNAFLNHKCSPYLAGCLCMEEKEEGMESSFFVLILDLMEEEKPTSL